MYIIVDSSKPDFRGDNVEWPVWTEAIVWQCLLTWLMENKALEIIVLINIGNMMSPCKILVYEYS